MFSNRLLMVAQEIAAPVSDIIRHSTDLGIYTGAIGNSGDRLKRGDQLVGDALRKIITSVIARHQLPGAAVICEETGYWTAGESTAPEAIFLIIDPVDGSRNLRPHSTPRPFISFSVALGTLAEARQLGTLAAVSVGLIRDIFHDEEYSAVRGEGAWLNGTRLRSSPVTNLAEAFIGMSLDRRGEKLQTMLNEGLLAILLQTKCQRRLGLTTLDVCRVASGDYDAHVSLSGDAKVHDVAAAKLIVEEAGGNFFLSRHNQAANDGRWLAEIFSPGGNNSPPIGFKFVAAGNAALGQALWEVLHW